MCRYRALGKPGALRQGMSEMGSIVICDRGLGRAASRIQVPLVVSALRFHP